MPRPERLYRTVQWAEQGVLMLNASLTVRAHNANSHKKKVYRSLRACSVCLSWLPAAHLMRSTGVPAHLLECNAGVGDLYRHGHQGHLEAPHGRRVPAVGRISSKQGAC